MLGSLDTEDPAMLDDIKPGSDIQIKVVKRPTNAAAAKTLVRVLAKDPTHKAEFDRLAKVRRRGYNPQPRGGRTYAGHVVIRKKPVTGSLGEQGTVKATVDVIRDLRSVQRFVEVSAA